jgi:hypothetical protein
MLVISPNVNVSADPGGRAVCDVGLDRLVADIMGWNPAQGMDVCPRLSVPRDLATD